MSLHQLSTPGTCSVVWPLLSAQYPENNSENKLLRQNQQNVGQTYEEMKVVNLQQYSSVTMNALCAQQCQGSHFPAVTKFKGFSRVFQGYEPKFKDFFSKVASTYIWVNVHNTTFYLTITLPKCKTSPSSHHQSKVLTAANKERLECNFLGKWSSVRGNFKLIFLCSWLPHCRQDKTPDRLCKMLCCDLLHLVVASPCILIWLATLCWTWLWPWYLLNSSFTCNWKKLHLVPSRLCTPQNIWHSVLYNKKRTLHSTEIALEARGANPFKPNNFFSSEAVKLP